MPLVAGSTFNSEPSPLMTYTAFEPIATSIVAKPAWIVGPTVAAFTSGVPGEDAGGVVGEIGGVGEVGGVGVDDELPPSFVNVPQNDFDPAVNRMMMPVRFTAVAWATVRFDVRDAVPAEVLRRD